MPGFERLYLVGPFQHPGGGVFGAGRAAAMRAFEDLKLDFDKVEPRMITLYSTDKTQADGDRARSSAAAKTW